MAAGSTYTPIATTTLGSDTASYTFSSISGSYTDLIIVGSVKVGGSGDYLGVQFNGDTGSNYSRTRLSGNGSAASSERESNAVRVNMYNQSNANFFPNILHIMNYANTTTYKTFLSRNDISEWNTNAQVALWRNTAAITSITLIGGGNLATGTTLTLYGIASA
jgi:hypothetical protein